MLLNFFFFFLFLLLLRSARGVTIRVWQTPERFACRGAESRRRRRRGSKTLPPCLSEVGTIVRRSHHERLVQQQPRAEARGSTTKFPPCSTQSLRNLAKQTVIITRLQLVTTRKESGKYKKDEAIV